MTQHVIRVRSRDQHPIDIKVEAKSLTQLSFAIAELKRKQLLEKVLEAVTAAEGLAHDYFGGNHKNGLACSLGSAVRMFGNLDVNGDDALDIEAANDEYPELLPSQRRLVMIEWLHEQLQKIPVQPYFARQS